MDLYSSQHSPISDPEVPQLLSVPPPPYPLRIVKTEPMSVWPYTDPRPYTPQAIDSIGTHQNELDTYGYSDSPTYLSLSPVEIDAAGPSQSFLFTSEFLNYEYKPFFKMEDDLLVNNNRDEGYVSPTASLHSLTPPSDLRLHMRDSATDSGNSNDLTGIYETEDHHQFPLSENSTSPQPARTQCVKCGTLVDIGQCLKEATGHYLCFACHLQANPPVPVQAPHVEAPPRRARKKQSVNARSNQLCNNCGTAETRLWRRDFAGNVVCNACGLYEKLHKVMRPKSMRKDTIQTRRRKPRNAEAKKKVVEEAIASNAGPSVSRAISAMPQPMVMPTHPPPPYNNRYVTIEDPGNYQVLPSMGTLGFINAFRPTYGQYTG